MEISLETLADPSWVVLESLCFGRETVFDNYCGIAVRQCQVSCRVVVIDCYWSGDRPVSNKVVIQGTTPWISESAHYEPDTWQLCALHPTNDFSASESYVASQSFTATGGWKPSAKIQPTQLKASILIEPSAELPVTSEVEATSDCSPSSEVPVSAEVDPSTVIDASVEVNPSEKVGASGKLDPSDFGETIVYEISGEFSISDTLPSPSASPSQSPEILPEAPAAVLAEAAGLSAGGIAGIVIAIVALGAIGAAAWLYTRETPKAFSPPDEDPLPPIGLSIEQYQP
jgi:hypothetical protein